MWRQAGKRLPGREGRYKHQCAKPLEPWQATTGMAAVAVPSRAAAPAAAETLVGRCLGCWSLPLQWQQLHAVSKPSVGSSHPAECTADVCRHARVAHHIAIQ
jgi:hypothetical protein